MDEPRKGRQTPTQSIVLPYEKTYGNEAIEIYNTTGRTAQEWQELLSYDIMAVNEENVGIVFCVCCDYNANIRIFFCNNQEKDS